MRKANFDPIEILLLIFAPIFAVTGIYLFVKMTANGDTDIIIIPIVLIVMSLSSLGQVAHNHGKH